MRSDPITDMKATTASGRTGVLCPKCKRTALELAPNEGLYPRTSPMRNAETTRIVPFTCTCGHAGNVPVTTVTET